MKRFAQVLAVVACAAVVAMPAAAQEKKSTISAYGNYSKVDNQPDATGNVNLGYGYMVSPQLELDINVLQTFGSAASSSTGVGGGVQYYFSTPGKPGNLAPYGKLNAFSISSNSTSATRYGEYLGGAYAMTESSEFFVEAGATQLTVSGSSITSNATEVNFGMKYRF